jgi:hypothetical protein
VVNFMVVVSCGCSVSCLVTRCGELRGFESVYKG